MKVRNKTHKEYLEPGTLVKFIKKLNNELPIVYKVDNTWASTQPIEWKSLKYGELGLVIESCSVFNPEFYEHVVLFGEELALAWLDDLEIVTG